MPNQIHKHTAGPWTYDHKSGWINADHCCERGPMHIADIRGWGHLTGGGHGAHNMPRLEAVEIQDANAKLICAAPELLATLNELSGLYEALEICLSDEDAHTLSAAWERAEAAMAKAAT